MSKKKSPKNGFFFFMLDMQQAFKEEGRDVPMKDMPIFAGPSWAKLSDAQKQRYTQRAKEEKSKDKDKSSVEPLLTSGGILRSQLSDTSEYKDHSSKKNCTGALVMVSCLASVVLFNTVDGFYKQVTVI